MAYWYNETANRGASNTPASLTNQAVGGLMMADISVTETVVDSQLVPCRVCGEAKPDCEFYAMQIRNDRSAGECKDCTKSRVKHRARTNPKVQEYDRLRAKTPKRRAKARDITKRWREENPAGYKAHTAVSNAVRDGRISKGSCLFCESTEVHAHHKDYDKPFDVIWLCPKCHHRLHAAFPETEGQGKGASKP